MTDGLNKESSVLFEKISFTLIRDAEYKKLLTEESLITNAAYDLVY
jgi:hypothetical protein